MYNYDRRRYNTLEAVLQYVSGNFVTLDENDVRAINPVVQNVLDVIIKAMKKIDPLFEALYERLMYGGSFYDGLKVGQPNEFDIDMVLSLPKILNVQIIPASEAGFVNIILSDWDRLKKDRMLYQRYKSLDMLRDSNNYLIQDKVLQWVQKLVTKALNLFHYGSFLYQGIMISFSMGGPAATLHIMKNGLPKIDVDLVAVFRMLDSKWPAYPFRQNMSGCFTSFYVVPKAPKSNVSYKTRCWRLSFQEQEQVLLNDHNFCKSALRLLKKLRDTRDHNIPSYFIKTIFLWKLEEENNEYWNRSLNYVFMEMLNTYKKYLSDGKIPYYWNKKNNLLQYTDSNTTYNMKNYLQKMINTIERNLDSDPYIIAKFLLPKDEYIQLVHHFNNTVYECARNDSVLYRNFEENNNSWSKFSRILTGAAVIVAFVFFSNPTNY